MTDQERLKEISKVAGTLCTQMLDIIKKTDDNAIRFMALEIIYAGGYIEGLCGQPFEGGEHAKGK